MNNSQTSCYQKFNHSWILIVVIGVLLVTVSSCSDNSGITGSDDDENGEVEELNGINADELEAYEGDLGLIINTRDLVKKGYNPAKVNLTTTATEDSYDQELVIDPFTNIAQLRLSVESLSESAAAELRNGVGLDVEVLDTQNNIITSEDYSIISFEENENQINIDASDLDYQFQDLNFNENVHHFLQPVDANGNYSNDIVWKPSSALDTGVRLIERSSSFNPVKTSEQFLLYKFPNENNVFAFYSANTSRIITIGNETRTFRQSGAYSYPSTNPGSLSDDYRFKIQKESNGLYTIRGGADNNPLRRFGNSGDINWHTNTSGTIQYFRIIALDTDWESTELNTEYLQPILPSVETSFGFNSTLKNCGSGTLEQQVGIEREVTTTYTSAFSESIGLSGRITTSVDVSVSATAEASFFGSGGSVTGEVSAGLEVSTEASSTSTVSNEESVSETNIFFSNRTVTVPSGSASLVYDAYQTYSNVKVPYVKRVRLKGSHTQSSEALSGQEIATQLNFTNFSGVITNIGSDYVEITIRGNMVLDNIVDTQTEVKDVPANCD
jgi:hypothetical protein